MDTNTIISTSIGGVISALISWLFYWLGGRGLAKEAKQLHELNVLLLRAFEEAGLARLNRDENGRPIGLIIDVSSENSDSASAKVSCDAEIVRYQKQ